MHKHIFVLVTMALSLVATAAHSEDFASTAVSGPATWKKYEVRGIQLGTSRKQLKAKGFTCGKYPNQRCFKIMDKRCETGRCVFKEDAFGQWFELNGAKTQLDYMTIATTDTESALAYDIKLFIVPRQLLTPDSTLGKALIKKYGDPSDTTEPSSDDKQGGGIMQWRNPKIGNSGPTIYAECYDGDRCSLAVEDYGIMTVEREKQEELNEKKKRANQPAVAPEL